jgi:uncharacterized repeat protein (TIGR01451 family)
MDNEQYSQNNNQQPEENKQPSSPLNILDRFNPLKRRSKRSTTQRLALRVVNQIINAIPQTRLAKYIAIGLLLIFLLIIFAVIGDKELSDYTDFAQGNPPEGTPGSGEENQNIVFSKSAPDSVANGETITYTLSLSYSGTGNVVVSDQIPPNTEFVTASGVAKEEKDSQGRVNKVTWSLNDNLEEIGPAVPPPPTQGIDFTKYTQAPYFLPPPNNEPVTPFTSEDITRANRLGSLVNQYQNYLLTKREAKYVDPFLAVIWSLAIEGSAGNPYSWNCNDNGNRDINAGCVGWYNSGNWQVGGVQVSQASKHLADDFRAIYNNTDPATVQQVGQAAIDNGNITNPSSFPAISIEEIVRQAGEPGDLGVYRNTTPEEAKAQQLIAVLLMDPKLNAVTMSLEIAGDIVGRDNWAEAMRGWGSWYNTNMQRFSNRAALLATQYSGTYTAINPDQPTINKTFLLTVKPLNSDIYVENQAFAQEIGGTPKTPVDTGSGSGPNQETCNGYYILDNPYNDDGSGVNFGDPDCTLLAERSPADLDKLYDLLKELDPVYADEWFNIIIPCEAPEYNANTYYRTGAAGDTPDIAGAWGLYQMGRGKNGEFDHGDVDWRKQTTNAINYNKMLEGLGYKWEYWACADHLWGTTDR